MSILLTVRESLEEHRHVESGEAQRVGDGSLIAEIREGDQNAIDLIAMLFEQIGASVRARC